MGCITAYPAPGSRSNFPRLALPIFLNDAFEAGGGERASCPRSPALSPFGAYGQHGPVIRSRNAGCGTSERDGRDIFLLELPFQNLNGNVGYYSSSFGRWMLRREGGRVRREGGSSGGGSIDRPSPVAVAVHCHIIREERERALLAFHILNNSTGLELLRH